MGLKKLRNTLAQKSNEFRNIVKIGRTHLMDAVPITLGQVLSGYVQQIDNGIRAIQNALKMISELALGESGGHFELNAFKPLIATNVLQSACLLGDACS
jgi:fumarate hydratase class II